MIMKGCATMIDPEKYRLRAKLPVYRRRIDDALGIIEGILPHTKKPYVAFSCGKDSSVMAHLVMQVDKSVQFRFLSSGETRLVHNVDSVLGFYRNLGADIQEVNVDRVFSEEWKDATWTEQRKAGNKDFDVLIDGTVDGVFMGLRIEESRPRKMSLFSHQSPDLPPFCYRYKQGKMVGMIRCCPLALWTTEDIGAYIIQHGLPYLDWYDYSGFEGRTTARITGDAVRQNMLFWLKKNKPESFAILAQRFPEFGMYV